MQPLRDQILAETSGLYGAIDQALVASTVLASRYFTENPSPASNLVINQATNDLHDLLEDLESGRGRSVTRAARALIEHAINLHEVLLNPASAERYIDHWSIADQIEANAKIGVPLLKNGERQGEIHRLRKLDRDSRAAADSALDLYGGDFRRSWCQMNLRDRAARYGLSGLYEYYRLSSMLLHGAAGGARGTVSTTYRRPVHRTGPDLKVCVLAYHEGLRAYEAILAGMALAIPHIDLTQAKAAIGDLIDLWPDYRRTILKTDRELWPADAPSGAITVLRVWRNNKRDWFWYNAEIDMLYRALPPNKASLARDSVEMEAGIAEQMSGLPSEHRYVVLTTDRIGVLPRFDRPAQDDSDLLRIVRRLVGRT